MSDEIDVIDEVKTQVDELLEYVESHSLDFLESDWEEVRTRLEEIKGTLDEA